MRLAIFYSGMCLLALVAMAAIQLGWRPGLICEVYQRSFRWVEMACCATAFTASLGFAASQPIQQLPLRLRATSVMMAIFVPNFLAMGLIYLSPASGQIEILGILAKWTAAGLVTGLFCGLVSSFNPAWKAPEPEAPKYVHAVLAIFQIGVLALGIMLALPFWGR